MAGKQKIARDEAKKAKLERQQQREEQGEQKRRADLMVAAREREINVAVAEIDSFLPVGEYLGALRVKLCPLERLRRYGPRNGEIAYILPYKTQRYERTHTERPQGRFGVSGESYTIVDEAGLERSVIDTRIGHEGEVSFGPSSYKIRGGLDLPLTLSPFSLLGPNYNRERNQTFNVAAEGWLQQFARTLIDFYVGTKTG